MKSVIDELWYGNICPQESEFFSTPQLKELLDYTDRHCTELKETLTDKQKELLEKMMDCQAEYNSLLETAVFDCGFKLGAKIMLEAVLDLKIG